MRGGCNVTVDSDVFPDHQASLYWTNERNGEKRIVVDAVIASERSNVGADGPQSFRCVRGESPQEDKDPCVLDQVMGGKETFESWYPLGNRRNPFYTYESLCEALEVFPDFANTGNLFLFCISIVEIS